jgi:hypothetical protein
LDKLPDYREKQRILYIDKRSDKDLIGYGDHYLESGRISDAADFYQKADNTPGLEKIREMAEATGDIMTFQQVMKALKQIATESDWNRIGQRAIELKKYAFALHAFEKSNNTIMIEQVNNLIKSENYTKAP